MWIIRKTCLTCQSPLHEHSLFPSLCKRCANQIPFIHPSDVQCQRCGRAIACIDCTHGEARRRAFQLSRSAVRYSPEMRNWLRTYKFLGEQRLALAFAEMMVPVVQQIVQTQYLRRPVLTYVPISATRARERGFNQAELLARRIAHRTGLSVSPTLVRIAEAGQQSMYKRGERVHTSSSSFEAISNMRMSGDSVIIIDDVYTTGATLAACSESIKNALNIPIFCTTWARSG